MIMGPGMTTSDIPGMSSPMKGKTKMATRTQTNAKAQTVSTDEDWENVREEFQIKWDIDGDTFTAILLRLDDSGEIKQAHFEGTRDYAGEKYFTNAGRDLWKKLLEVPLGNEVRITRDGTLDTGKANPMITYSVQHRAITRKS
jgi:hypothetical protein